ncbi:MAG: WG repeat-containing protein [Bacteroidota bacterium]
MKAFAFLLSILWSFFVYTQKIKTGFEALAEFDYFKAKKIFYKNLKKNTTLSSYGLSIIYLRKDNPFHNFDSAYLYATKSHFSFKISDDNLKNDYLKYGINESVIKKQCDSVFKNSYEYYSKKYEQNDTYNDSIINKFISWHYYSPYRESAIKKRDEVLISSTRNHHTSENYKEFISNWPESYSLADAYYLLDKAIYEENTSLGTTIGYQNFIKNFPNNRFVISGQNEIFKIHKKNRDKEGLINFIKSYAGNENCNEAWKLFFSLTVKEYNSDNLAEFVLDYPEFPFKKTIIQEIELFKKPLLKIKKEEMFGFIDTTGNIIIPAKFEELGDFSEGLCVASESEKYGFIDKNGNWIIEAIYDEAESFIEGVSIVKLKNKFFLIDRNGSKISEEFEQINSFSEGLAIAKQSNKYGAINKLGNIVIPFNYEKIGDFKNEHAWFQSEGKFGILDNKNFETIRNEFDWIEDFSENIRAKKNNGYGVINKTGNTIIAFEYERIDKHNSGIFILVKNNKYGFADKKGCLYTAIEFDFDNKLESNELFSIIDQKKQSIYFKLIKDEEQALMNQNGKLLCDFGDYEEIYPPSSGLIRVFSDDVYHYLDLKLKSAFSSKFEDAEDFVEGTAIVKKKGKWMIIDKSGNILFDQNCESIERPENEMYNTEFFIIKNKTGYGVLNKKMNYLILSENEEIDFSNEGYITMFKDGKRNFYDIKKNKFIYEK